MNNQAASLPAAGLQSTQLGVGSHATGAAGARTPAMCPAPLRQMLAALEADMDCGNFQNQAESLHMDRAAKVQ
jgi:hypothetical protein